MRPALRYTLIVLLAVFAAGTSLATAYSFSILARGAWKDRELVVPICAAALATILALSFISALCTGTRHLWITAGVTVALTVACGAVTTGLFFGVLENCHLSCGTKTKAISRSPSGRWSAIWRTEDCVSATRYCPTISRVFVVPQPEQRRVSEIAFSIETDSGVELEWKSDRRLLIRYWPLSRILKRTNTVGTVRIEYQPIPIL